MNEYGTGKLRRALTFFVDVMTGIPSIVAGLFAYALFELFFGPGIRMGVMGSVALSVLMIPIVIRSSEEVLKIVPNHLREAAYALGTPKWKTIAKIVLPTAFAGLVTGVMIATARIIGETAPLLVTTGVVDSLNTDPFGGRMQNLAVYAYNEYRSPGIDKTAVLRPRLGGRPDADRDRDDPQRRSPASSTAATKRRSAETQWREGNRGHVRITAETEATRAPAARKPGTDGRDRRRHRDLDRGADRRRRPPREDARGEVGRTSSTATSTRSKT